MVLKPIRRSSAHSLILSKKKGHFDLFAAMPAVLRELPKTQFWIVGQGELWRELHEIAEKTGVMNNVRFLGFRRDVADLMNAIDVMALPSQREPCALVYVEAALSRKPCIACRSGGAPRINRRRPDWHLGAHSRQRRDCRVAPLAAHESRSVHTHGAGRVRARGRPVRLGPIHLHARTSLRTSARRKRRQSQVEPTLGRITAHQKTMSPTKTIRRLTKEVSGRPRCSHRLLPNYEPALPLRSQRAPRVLHAITPSKMAGAETFLARLMRRASLDQFVSHFVTSRSRANLELLAANLPFDRLGIGGKANLLAVPRLALAARRFQADLLHSHLSTASWWCGWLEQFGGPPSIGHVHGFTSAQWHRHQSHLIACSNAVRQDLIAKGNCRRPDHRDALSDRPERHATHALAGRYPPRTWCRTRYARRRHVCTSLAKERPPRTDSSGRARPELPAESAVLVLRRRPAPQRTRTNGARARNRRPIQTIRLPSQRAPT